MLPLLTCQLHAQEVNDDEEDNTEETTKVSSLLMPNAFSPNGDGINDIYKPKDGYRNIEEFHAYIYNRWGQKLYEWTDHVCPFAVRVPHGLSLADFLGSMITHTIRFLRGGLRTLKFSSDGGFACHPQRLHSSTGTSVAPRWFHCSVSTSPHAAVTEY